MDRGELKLKMNHHGIPSVTCCGGMLVEALDDGGFACPRCGTLYELIEIIEFVQDALEDFDAVALEWTDLIPAPEMAAV